MYIPSYYKITDMSLVADHLQKHPFGMLVSMAGGKLSATHLPFIFEKKENEFLIESHLSKANDQWKDLEGQEVLLIFQGHHGYISPSNYEKKENVPTWNYTAVQMRGTVTLKRDDEDALRILEKTINVFESAYMPQWEGLSKDYVSNMIKGLVAFEFKPTSIEAKYKLSQNKTELEKKNIINHLEKSDDNESRQLSEVMKKFYQS